MNIQKILTILTVVGLIFSGCRKIEDNPKPSQNKTMDELNIPGNFNWETYSDVNLNVAVDLTQNTTAISKISVFYGDPGANGKLVASGSASSKSTFNTTIRVPAALKEIYLVCEFPFGGSSIQALPVSKNIDYTFSNAKSSNIPSGLKSISDAGPECDDCDLVISGNGSYTIGNGQKACITENFTGSITFESWTGAGTLQVCGTATISNLQLTEDAHIIVTQEGSLTIGSFSSWGNNGTITIYENAELIINNNFQTQGNRVENQGLLTVNGNMTVQNLTSNEFVNSGIITLNGNFQLNNGPVFYNDGTLNATGTSFLLNSNSTFENTGTLNINSNTANNFQINSGSNFTNNGNLNVGGNISINAGSSIINNCAMICTGNFAVNSGDFITTSGFLKGAQSVVLNYSNNIQLRNGSMISTVNLTMNSGGVLGSGSLNSILVSGTFTIYSNNKVDGPIESATDDLQISNGTIADHFVNGATVVGLDGITNYIESGSCNPDGIGMEVMIDSDGDGVPDATDDYPDDFYRAFNNFFPDESGSVSIVFEDLWPGTGDYDFNDLVLGMNGNEITNASNEVVEINVNLNVRAVGASLQNGFGWQFAGITPNQIEQVSGYILRPDGQSAISLNANGTEQGQDSAVIIAIENIEDVLNRNGGSMFNTMENGMVGTSDLVSINILFGETTPIQRRYINQQAYNIFLIKNQERDTEIHLTDREPTNKMSTTLFGTAQDISDPNTGTYFKTANHLPWALIIMDNFAYPIETIPIIDAYPDFASWAESGGTINTNWYENPDPTKIWTP